MAEVFVARQPIFDRKMQVIGYELLFREGQANSANVIDPSAATATVMLNALTEIGLKRIVGARSAWLKFSAEFVNEGLTELLPQRAVIEILPTDQIDDQLLASISAIKRRGNRVALDRFTFAPEAEPLLRMVDVVKLDLVALGRRRFSDELARVKTFGVQLLASRVENRKDHTFCRAAGCELFQGYFFCRPEIMQGTRIDANRLAVLDLLSTLQDPELELGEIGQKIALDVSLSVRLLRYINSAFFGMRQPVRSIGQAVALLGIDHLKRWAALTLFASVADKPTELTITALVRARFCELAAATNTQAASNELFTVGLFSVIDALLDAPIEEALNGVPLAQDIRDAIINHSGPMGQLLDCITALESAELEQAQAIVANAGELYMEAIAWADEAAEPLLAR